MRPSKNFLNGREEMQECLLTPAGRSRQIRLVPCAETVCLDYGIWFLTCLAF